MGALRVLMFGWELAPVISGGLGVVSRSIVDALVKKGVQVTFVIPKVNQQIPKDGFKLVNASDYDQSQDTLHTITITTRLVAYPEATYYNQEFNIWRRNHNKKNYDHEIYGINLLQEVEQYAENTAKFVKKVKCDVIHAHDWMTSVAAIKAKKILKKPLIVHIHSTEFDRTAGHPNERICEYEKYALENADKIVAVSNFTKDILIDKYQIDPKKIKVIHNTIDGCTEENHKKITNSEVSKTVLFLARLSVQKGADYLLKAAKKVLRKMPNVKFVIVGRGGMLEHLIDLSISLGISQSVIFAGQLSHDEVDKAYKHADLFVMPSISEPFGITSLEAVRNGTPVLISKQSGAAEVLKNCLKVDFWDINQMANKILAVLQDNALAESLSDHGHADLKNLTWEKQILEFINLYRSVK